MFLKSKQRIIRFAVLAVTSVCLAMSSQAVAAPATMDSLLSEMVDREAAAHWPIPAYTLKQASSYDRRKTNPANAETWHTNNDHEQFIRTETNEGRPEWVIMEDQGPGAITRFWTPLLVEKDNQIIRFYFDGSTTPAISVRLLDLLGGQSFVKPPLAFVSASELDLRNQLKPQYKAPRGVGADLYLPIPFAKSCKITLDQIPFYYVINYRMYAPGTAVQTFSMARYEAAKPTVAHVSAALLNDVLPVDAPLATNGMSKQARLAPGQELWLDLPRGSATVRELQVKIDPEEAPEVLRSVILQATFDNEPTIWCPIGEFFGAGARLNAVHDWNRTVGKDGLLSARWIMPYAKTARLSLKNVGEKPITAKLAAATGRWAWDERSMHFHAGWHSQHDIRTRPYSNWNYIDIAGRGVYVGDTLTVYSPAPDWYGEGDERISIDGEKLASHIGTGTEDYYGYAWGMAGFFNSPFLSTPRRDSADRGGGNWIGYTTTSRLRLLDGIPMRTSLNLNMEIWNWADTSVDYAVGTFWYALPGATSNSRPQISEARQPLKPAPPAPATPSVAESSGGITEIQYASFWKSGAQLWWRDAKPGDTLSLVFKVNETGRHEIKLSNTYARDYGIIRFWLDGTRIGSPIDFYNPDVAVKEVSLGTHNLTAGEHVLRCEIMGANVAADKRHMMGIEWIHAEIAK